MAINVRKLGHALGAEVSGVDISRPIDDQTFSEINRAFLENCVLVFHDQPLTREQHVTFSRRFGEDADRSACRRVLERELGNVLNLRWFSEIRVTTDGTTLLFAGHSARS